MNQLSKTAKIMASIVKVFKVIAVIGIVASIIGAILMGAGLLLDLDPSKLGELEYSMSLGTHTFHLSEDAPLSVESIWKVGLVSMLASIPSIIVTYLFLKTVGDILEPMKEGKPFYNTVSVSLKKLGIIGIVMCLLEAVANFVSYGLVMLIYPVQELLGDYVTHIEFVGGINLDYLLMVGVCFLLSYVFRYGTELQKQSDETL